MKYEEPIMEIIDINSKDLVLTNSGDGSVGTEGYNMGGEQVINP